MAATAERTAARLRWTAGWWRDARRCPSPNHGPRPRGTAIDLAVVHSISLPPGEYGGDAVHRLFLNRLDPDEHPAFTALRGLQVSAHFFLRRDGELWQFVACDRRAWHAGISQWRGRPNCNDYSVGIELEGLEGERFTPVQYAGLARLLRALAQRFGVREVVGHEHVAPGRKHDPGPGFDWRELQQRLRRTSLQMWPRGSTAMRPGGAKRRPGRTSAGPSAGKRRLMRGAVASPKLPFG